MSTLRRLSSPRADPRRMDPAARGVALLLAAVACLTLLDTTGKYLSASVSILTITWARYVFHVLFVLAWVIPRRGLGVFASRRPMTQITRGALIATMSLLFFAALKVMPLAETTAINFLTPMLVTLLAWFFMRERVGRLRWLAIFAGLVGVLVVIRPGGTLPLFGVLMGLGAALANAWYQLLTRVVSRDDDVMTSLVYAGLVGAVALSVTLPFWWQQSRFDAKQWSLLVACGALGAAGHLLLIRAYALAPPAHLASWMYLQLLWAALAGWTVFGQIPDAIGLVGMAIIAISPNLVRLGSLRARPSA